MTLPVKSLSEIEVKSEVSENDKILILDSVSEEARLARKDELKGDKGDDGEPGTPGAAATVTVGTTSTLPAGSSATVSNTGTSSAAVFNFGIPKGDQGDPGTPGADGDDGNGITSVTSSKVGKTTTVTMNFDEGDPFSFQVQDGQDGGGSGDMMKSVYDPNNKEANAFDYNNFINTPDLSGFITKTVSDLTYYYTKSETYTQAEINTLISNFGGFEVVATLPTQDIKTNVIYLKGPIGTGADKYEEWIYYSNTRTKIGDTSVDLTNYFNTSTQTSDNITEGSTNKFVTSTEKSEWSGKQDALTLPATPTQGHLVTWGVDNETFEDGGAVPAGVPAGGTNGQVLTNVNGTPTWANPTGGIQEAPNSPITGIKYVWRGSEAQYAALSQYYTDVPGDTEFRTYS